MVNSKETKEIAKHHSKMLLAFLAGEHIQSRKMDSNEEWGDVNHTSINLYVYELRIKPNPKEIWVNYYEGRPIAVHDTIDSAQQGSRYGNDPVYLGTEHFIQVMDE